MWLVPCFARCTSLIHRAAEIHAGSLNKLVHYGAAGVAGAALFAGLFVMNQTWYRFRAQRTELGTCRNR